MGAVENLTGTRTDAVKRIWKNGWVRRPLLLVLGAAGGYAYYAFIGCASGTCPITSNPYISTAWGSAIAVLAGWGES